MKNQKPANATGISRTGLSQEDPKLSPGKKPNFGAVQLPEIEPTSKNVYKAVTGNNKKISKIIKITLDNIVRI